MSNEFDTPLSRTEAILQNALGAENKVDPMSRVEILLDDLDKKLGDIPDLDTYSEMVTDAVEDWMDENIHDGSAAVVDNTLSISGAAADAAVTGAEFTSVKSDLDEKANIDGSYVNLKSGLADNLDPDAHIDDTAAYCFRTSGGTADIGEFERLKKVVGGTVAWNQLVQNGNFADSTGWEESPGSIEVSNNVITYTPTTYTDSSALNGNVLGTIKDHKYIIGATIKYNAKLPHSNVFIGSGGYDGCTFSTSKFTLNSWVPVAGVFQRNTGGSDKISFYPRTSGWESGDTVSVKNFFCIDLTALFGSTIADYIYSLEQATAGAGVAWFRKYFPKDYYAYSAPTLQHVQVSKHKTVGFNQWDEEWEVGGISASTGENTSSSTQIRSKNFCPCVPGTNYCKTAPNTNYLNVFWYDSDKNFISVVGGGGNVAYSIVTSPSNAHFFKVRTDASYGTTYNNDICINLHWDGSRDGEYEPYSAHEYALDSDLVLRGIPKKDSSGNLYFDGDEYESDGTVTRRYGIVDLDDIEWARNTSQNYFYGTLPGVSRPATWNTRPNIICPLYIADTPNHVFDNVTDKTISISQTSDSVMIYNSAYTDAAAFKTAMSGVYLIYELATPTTESADAFTEYQSVDDFGTEEFVDAATRDVMVPVGHLTEYPPDLKAKLEMSPDSPPSDGLWLVQHSSGTNEYVQYVSPVPTLPSTDGTHTLKVTVSGSTKTVAWVADE